ncbi:MAG: hypothetical protein K2N63_08275 [Lachnospiraceae bacterium]|nr:hypothetical protein [Lachnospiraceae bacterium]
MPQKLSAMNYIKNNMRRVAVLIVSLGLCFVLVYLTQFMLSTTEESFKRILIGNTGKMQVISLAGKTTLGIPTDQMGDEEINAAYTEKNRELAEKLREMAGVKDAWYGEVINNFITAAVGQITYNIPLVEKEKIPEIMEYFSMKLIEGRLPEHPGEIILDSLSMKNNDYVLGRYCNERNYDKYYKIVGIVECDTYFGCGISSKDWISSWMIVVLSEGIEDMSAVLHEIGINVKENYDTVVDMKWGKTFLQEGIIDVISNSSNLIYMGIVVLLLISLTIVYTTYLRDRHNEWCLYCSIGYSRANIYHAVVWELLFTFGAAFLAGGIISILAAVLLRSTMLIPQGLQCKIFHPKAFAEILCIYVFLLGILQIPVRYALGRIRTIDAIEDDLY